MAFGSKPEICFPSSIFILARYRLAREGISSERLLREGRFSVWQPSLAMKRRAISGTGSLSRQSKEKRSLTRLASPVSCMAAKSSDALCSGIASKF